MGGFDERKAIYEQMRLLIEERREISKTYYGLKEQLEKLNGRKEKTEKDTFDREQEPEKSEWGQETENQKYFLSKTNRQTTKISYQDLGYYIASLLKEVGVPLSTKRIYDMIKENKKYEVTYSNLSGNILPKIHQDSSINVERAYRGYWQYRNK